MLGLTEFEFSGHPTHVVEPETAEYVPAPQSVHVATPVVPLNLPATHSVHGPPFGPDEPALHVQAISAELEIGEYELEGHTPHTLVVALTAVEYLPASQSVHVLP